jgi:BirA family biotin operon repressor/biotin-[acetyl-CoA-carboxylase] ligase
VVDLYREACSTIGRQVRVELPSGPLVGQAQGVDDRGHLVVRTSAGEVVVVSAGDVVHVRPS